jgi:hypothetical protein
VEISRNEQNDDHHQENGDKAARTVPPVARVVPARQAAEEKQDQDDKKHKSHEISLAAKPRLTEMFADAACFDKKQAHIGYPLTGKSAGAPRRWRQATEDEKKPTWSSTMGARPRRLTR